MQAVGGAVFVPLICWCFEEKLKIGFAILAGWLVVSAAVGLVVTGGNLLAY